MNDLPRRKLFEIVGKYGASVVENPRRVEGLLRDYAGAFRREISVLTMALEERVPLDLLAAKATPRAVLFGRLAQRLCDNLALSEQAARWSVHSWALALQVVSESELKNIEQQTSSQIETTAILTSTATQTKPQNKTQSPQSQPNQIQDVQTQAPASKPAAQKSFVVSADGAGDFASIGDALKNVAPDARLIVRAGIYQESVVIDKTIEIVGDGAAADIIIASSDASCLQMRADKATVRGLTIRGVGAHSGKAFFAVDIRRGELILEDCDISSDTLSCVAIHGVDANPTIKNCRIHDGADSGVYFFDSARGQILDSDICRNRNDAVAITNGANPLIKNCRIFAGENGGIVAWQNGAAGLIEDCEIFNHRLANVGVSQYANPTVRRCKIYGGADAGVFVQNSGGGTFEECEIYQNEDAEVAVSSGADCVFKRCAIHGGRNSGVVVRDSGRVSIDGCNIYDNRKSGVSVETGSVAEVRRSNIHRNGIVAVSVRSGSRATVEASDLRGNRVAAWETESGVTVERKNNRE